ncbi:MAG: response regulator [Deltaproteobacteria bacterium]|nr:MAG: response regulator [Deltaproteobacteria bacterium]
MTIPPLKRILVAEDEADILELVTMILESLGGFEVEGCTSGTALLGRAPTFSPDLILMDVMMPALSGPETLARLREDPRLETIPVVFMTAKVQRHEIRRYRDLGVIGVIAKPFDPMRLVETITGIWSMHHG